MFRSINSKFYAIVGVLALIFCIGYAILAYFLSGQSQSTVEKTMEAFRNIDGDDDIGLGIGHHADLTVVLLRGAQDHVDGIAGWYG